MALNVSSTTMFNQYMMNILMSLFQ